jgi:AcrR family transcriptional regulator
MTDPRRRLRLPPEERRAHLMECALSVFSQLGLGTAHHAQVATEAGVAVSTVFLYFPTRAELIDAVLSEVERFYTELGQEAHASDAPVREVLRAHGRAFIDSLDSHPRHARILLDWSTAFREDVWARYRAFNEERVERMAVTLRRSPTATDPESSARLLVGVASMLIQLRLQDCDPSTIDRFARAARESVLE